MNACIEASVADPDLSATRIRILKEQNIYQNYQKITLKFCEGKIFVLSGIKLQVKSKIFVFSGIKLQVKSKIFLY